MQSPYGRATGKPGGAAFTVREHLAPGGIKSVTARSPYDLLAVKGSTYGEVSSAYSGADAEGSAKLHGYEQRLCYSLGKQVDKEKMNDAA